MPVSLNDPSDYSTLRRRGAGSKTPIHPAFRDRILRAALTAPYAPKDGQGLIAWLTAVLSVPGYSARSTQGVSDWLHGMSLPSERQIQSLARALHREPLWLLEGHGPEMLPDTVPPRQTIEVLFIDPRKRMLTLRTVGFVQGGRTSWFAAPSFRKVLVLVPPEGATNHVIHLQVPIRLHDVLVPTPEDRFPRGYYHVPFSALRDGGRDRRPGEMVVDIRIGASGEVSLLDPAGNDVPCTLLPAGQGPAD